MLPYFELDGLAIGSFQLSIARLLVGCAIVAGHFLLIARARRMGLDPSLAAIFSAFVTGGGLLFGHWFKLLYWPTLWQRVWEHPVFLITVGYGQASIGGVLGGLLCGYLFLLRRAPRGQAPQYLDALAMVFPYAWLIGRLHCVLVHDHPGIRTDNWLGVRYPDGVRFDLAVIEVLFLLVLMALFRWMERKPHAAGTYCGVFLVSYGIFRILLDRLHVDVVRYGGLAVDQWGGGLMLVCGAVFLVTVARPASSWFTSRTGGWIEQVSSGGGR